MKKIFLLSSGWLLVVVTATAQTDVYNTGQLYISNSSDTVYITGSLYNANTAGLNNVGGNLYVFKNINNDEANMQAGGGKLWFPGSALQNITGAQQMRTFNWIVNNVAGVNLQNRIGIGNGTGGTLSFVNGLITSGTNAQDVYFYTNSNYTGYTDNAHIIGYCSKSGSSNFTFPVGNGTLKADLDITNLSSATDFQCKYFGAGYGTYTPSAPLVSVFDKEYWTLDRTVGVSPAQITLKWNDARKLLNHIAPSDLRAGHFTGSSWISEGGVGSGNTATGTVSSISVNSFSPFTFASESTVLPLKITDYSATGNSICSVNINWNSHDETEISGYIIQKSKDNRSWEEVATIPVNVTSITTASHSYTDNPSVTGTWIYRMRAEKKNGGFIYTESKIVKLNCKTGSISVYPAVTSGSVNISVRNNLAIKNITIFNQNGQLLQKKDGPINGSTSLNFSGYPAGEYNIVIITAEGTRNFKIIKTN